MEKIGEEWRREGKRVKSNKSAEKKGMDMNMETEI